MDINLESIITGVWTLGINPFELTIYQLYALFNRLVSLKNYDASIVGSAFGGSLTPWFAPFRKEEKDNMTDLEEFKEEVKKMGIDLDDVSNFKKI